MLMLISCVLALPGVVLLAVGSFPAAAEVQERFGTGHGPAVVTGFGVAGLAWLAVCLALLLHQWTITGSLVHGETLALIRFRVWTAVGGAAAGCCCWPARPPTEVPHVQSSAIFTCWTRWTSFWPTGLRAHAAGASGALSTRGGLALAGTGGAVGTLTVEAAVHAAALGTLGVTLMAVSANGHTTGGDSPGEAKPQEARGPERQGEGSIDETEKAFLPKERKIAETLEAEGRNVKALNESAVDGVKTPDALVDGVPTEFKTLEPGAPPNAVKNTLNTARSKPGTPSSMLVGPGSVRKVHAKEWGSSCVTTRLGA
ncbi:hypothetical protein NKH77_46845 [Streptomyces sp. M19]